MGKLAWVASIFNLILNPYVSIKGIFNPKKCEHLIKKYPIQIKCDYSIEKYDSKYQKFLQGLHCSIARLEILFGTPQYPDQGPFQSKLNSHIEICWSPLNLGSVGWTLSTIPFKFNWLKYGNIDPKE